MKKFPALLLLLLFACTTGNGDDDMEIARVGNSYLYRSDIMGLVPENTSPRDSNFIVQGHINNWIEQQLIIRKAKENLTAEERDFSRQLDEYLNSLMIYTYETKLIKQYLDTIVDNAEIDTFYNSFSQNFALKDNIIKFNFVKVHVDSPEINRLKELVKSSDEDDLHILEDYCKSLAADYWLEDRWLVFGEIKDQVPVEIDDEVEFIKRNRNIQLREDPYWYLVSIKDYKLVDSIAPVDFARDEIRSIIINNRKLKLIKEMRQDLMKTAIDNHEVEIYQ